MNGSDVAYIITCTIFVFFMTPGLAIFYGGLVRRKNLIGIMEQTYISIGIVGVLWTLFGFTLVFGESIGGLIGNSSYMFMNNVGISPNVSIAPNLPFILFFVLQMAYAIITPALIAGAVAERMSFKAYMVMIAMWLLLVYCPTGNWVWGGGWLARMGVIDFAGGLVIHLSAGMSAMAAVCVIGSRKKMDYTPCNMGYVSIGAGILWMGWFAFNGASAYAANGVAGLAVANTLIASSAGIFGWMCMSYPVNHKITLLDTLMGGIAGLVVITPMAGFVQPIYSLPVGFFGSLVCASAVRLRTSLNLDDTLDVWALHGVGGAFGLIFAGVLADPSVAPKAGLIYGNGGQLFIQVIGVAAVALYAFVMTVLILKVISIFTPLRLSKGYEEIGMDSAVHGEKQYN